MKYENLSLKQAKKFKNKKIIIRLGLNVPVKNNKIENDFRLQAILPTLVFLQKAGARIVIIGHLGRKPTENLNLIFHWLKKNLKSNIFFNRKTFIDFHSQKIKQEIEKISSGEILLLDNLRSTLAEKENSTELAKKLAENFDFYINEAFPVSHRQHMSMNALPKKFKANCRFLGFQYQAELAIIKKIKNPQKFKYKIFILGGSKIKTKIPLIKKMLSKFDLIILGGAVVNNFYQKLGYEIGQSFWEPEFSFVEKDWKKIINSKKIFIPNLVLTQSGEKEISELKKKDKILDISPGAFYEIEYKLKQADFVFFNGPVGYYEGGYQAGTKFLLEILANPDNFFIAGGGNTVSAIFKLKLENNVDFISTGGGALISKLSE